jgi:hypothetical protein
VALMTSQCATHSDIAFLGRLMKVMLSFTTTPTRLFPLLGRWRRRAAEARTLADELTNPEAKRKMLKIAEDYETLARRPARRLRQHSANEGAA